MISFKLRLAELIILEDETMRWDEMDNFLPAFSCFLLTLVLVREVASLQVVAGLAT